MICLFNLHALAFKLGLSGKGHFLVYLVSTYNGPSLALASSLCLRY